MAGEIGRNEARPARYENALCRSLARVYPRACEPKRWLPLVALSPRRRGGAYLLTRLVRDGGKPIYDDEALGGLIARGL